MGFLMDCIAPMGHEAIQVIGVAFKQFLARNVENEARELAVKRLDKARPR